MKILKSTLLFATVVLVIVTPSAALAEGVTMTNLPGRHLEIPWWEATSMPAPHTYVVPAGVLFATGSSTISAEGQSVLGALAGQLLSAQSIIVAGCTDDVGGARSSANYELGLHRAEQTAGVLAADGVPRPILHPVSWADTHPVKTPRGLDQATIDALQRRVVIIVTTRR